MSYTLEEARAQFLGEVRRDHSVDGPKQDAQGTWEVLFGKKQRDGEWTPVSVNFGSDEEAARQFAKELLKKVIELQVHLNVVARSE